MEIKKKGRVRNVKHVSQITMTIQCPHCDKSLNVSHVPIDEKIHCVECQKPFKIDKAATIEIPKALKELLSHRAEDKHAEAFYAPHSSAPDAKELFADRMGAVCPKCASAFVLDPSIADADDLEFKCPSCNKPFGIGKKTKLKLHPLALFQLNKLHSIW